MAHTSTTAAEVFTTIELRKKLKLSRGGVMNLLTAGAFPNAFQIGRRWRVPAEDLAEYIRKNRVKPA